MAIRGYTCKEKYLLKACWGEQIRELFIQCESSYTVWIKRTISHEIRYTWKSIHGDTFGDLD